MIGFFFFSSRRRHTIFSRDWSSDVCSSDLDWRSEIHRTKAVPRVALMAHHPIERAISAVGRIGPQRKLLVLLCHERSGVGTPRKRGPDRVLTVAASYLVPANSKVAESELWALAARHELDARE